MSDPSYCAIDFGTSNSAIALPTQDASGQTFMPLVPVEAGQPTMPTAVFYGLEDLHPHEAPRRLYGRAAMAAYIEGHEGRLMRSMKSVLGSSLVDQSTDLGQGHSVRFLDVLSDYLGRLKSLAEAQGGQPLRHAVLGRPVFFVDDDPARDAQAQAALTQAARQVGFETVHFQFEPIAAALDHESRIDHEQLVLVADIGGGTSDFTLIRLGPQRRQRVDRADDILASHGVHIAGTDFDRHLDLAALLPLAGYRSRGPAPAEREVPSKVYFDLATWHLVNTVSTPARVQELRRMRSFYADLQMHARLMTVVEHHLGHALLAEAERAKIALAGQAEVALQLDLVEPGLGSRLDLAQAESAMAADLQRIADAVGVTLRQAGVSPDAVDVLYLTGGSTGLDMLVQRLAAQLPAAQVVRGDRLASVAQGLGVHAQRVFSA